MWICKIKLKDEKGIYGIRTKNFNVRLIGYSLNNTKKGNKTLLVAIARLIGEEKNKRKFLNDLKKDKRVEKLDIKKDFFIALTSEPVSRQVDVLFNPLIFHIKPVVIENGIETWEIASWNRKLLTNLIDVVEKQFNGKLYYLKEEKVSDLFILHARPDLTKMQKKVISRAKEMGYYSYPRKTEIKKIAETLNISFSTCQEHLRKAEIKLLPFMIDKL